MSFFLKFALPVCVLAFTFNPNLVASEKEPKTLILIIDSDNSPAYAELRAIWRSYMHLDKERFEAYFIRGNPDLKSPFEFVGDTLYLQTEESFKPGIVKKSIFALEAFGDHFKDFDFVLRTNLSSFYDLATFQKLLRNTPKKNVLAGEMLMLEEGRVEGYGYISFISGAGILFSRDVAEILVRDKEEIFKHGHLPDDVLIGWYLQHQHIPPRRTPRFDFLNYQDWLVKREDLPPSAFHFRAKSHMDFRQPGEAYDDEIKVLKDLWQRFYNPYQRDS